MLLVKLKIATTVVLAVTVAFAGVGMATYRALAVKAEEDAPARNAAEIGPADSPRHKEEAPRSNAQQPAPQDGADDALVHLSASGKVVDSQGRPIAGATVYLREIPTSRDTGEIQNQTYTDILAQMTTDANGRFAFKDVSAKPMKPSRVYKHPWNIVITSKGYGLTWHVFQSRHEENLALSIPPESRLHGRLLDSNGKPAVGVRVELSGIIDQLDPNPQNWVYTPDRLDFRVEAGKNPEVPDLVLLANSLPLAGRVVDAAGKPIPEVEVTIARLIHTPDHGTASTGFRSMKTDRDGRFHFFGLPNGEYQLTATLSKPTGMTNASGPSAFKSAARTELRVESGKEDLRIVLQVP